MKQTPTKTRKIKLRARLAKVGQAHQVAELAEGRAAILSAAAVCEADARVDTRLADASRAAELAVEEVLHLREHAAATQTWAADRAADLASVRQTCATAIEALRTLDVLAETMAFAPPVAPPALTPESAGVLDALLAEKEDLRRRLLAALEEYAKLADQARETAHKGAEYQVRAVAGTPPPWLRREAARLDKVPKPLARALAGDPVVRDVYATGLRALLWAQDHQDLPMPAVLARADDQRAMLHDVGVSLRQLLAGHDADATIEVAAEPLRRLATLVEVVMGAPMAAKEEAPTAAEGPCP